MSKTVEKGGTGYHFVGEFPCPMCGSKRTGTPTMGTSCRRVDFTCLKCEYGFKIYARRVAAISKQFAALSSSARAVSGMFNF